eukprot:2331657-Alexandrium_andersonii.AAC.1
MMTGRTNSTAVEAGADAGALHDAFSAAARPTNWAVAAPGAPFTCLSSSAACIELSAGAKLTSRTTACLEAEA